MNEKAVLDLDWLGFTFKPDVTIGLSPLDQFWNMFPEFDRNLLSDVSFRTLYTNTYNYCGMFISFNTFTSDLTESQCSRFWGMGVNVQIPSSMLGFFFDLLGIDITCTNSFALLLKELATRHCKPSRIDLCYDDYSKSYDVSYYRLKNALKLIQTPYMVTLMGRDSQGLTMYFGSLKKRSKLLRIYDKWLQSNGEIDAVRYEFEFHNDDAVHMADLICDQFSDGVPFVELLLGFVRVKDAQSVERCARIQDAKIDEEWINTLNNNLTLSCVIKVPSSDPQFHSELNHYIEVQALSSIAGYVKCYGRTALLELIRDALKHNRVSKKYQAFYNKLKSCGDLWEDDGLIDNPFF